MIFVFRWKCFLFLLGLPAVGELPYEGLCGLQFLSYVTSGIYHMRRRERKTKMIVCNLFYGDCTTLNVLLNRDKLTFEYLTNCCSIKGITLSLNSTTCIKPLQLLEQPDWRFKKSILNSTKRTHIITKV